MSVNVLGPGGILKIDNYTFTGVAAGDWCVIKPKSENLFTSVKGGLGSGAFVGNIDATVYQVEIILLNTHKDSKYLSDLYEEQVLAMTQNDFAILNKLNTIYASNGVFEFTGRQGKITTRPAVLTMSAQGSEDARTTLKFTLEFINGLFLKK